MFLSSANITMNQLDELAEAAYIVSIVNIIPIFLSSKCLAGLTIKQRKAIVSVLKTCTTYQDVTRRLRKHNPGRGLLLLMLGAPPP